VVPLRERVVEIEAALGTGSAERYRYGSGFRLGGRFVLTAAHTVAGGAVAGITVRGPDKVPHPARVVDGLVGDPGTVDLALLELCDEISELPSLPVARIDRDAPVPVPVEGCWAVGYPLFQEVESDAGVVRETAQVWGMILPAENLVSGLLSLQVTSSPRALPPRQESLDESQWSGMSGAAVLAGDQLIGVVSEHAPGRGESTITVTPLESLNRLPAADAARWWEHLNADPEHLAGLPARRSRAEPEYRAALRRLRARTGVLQDREKELREIGAFASGLPSTLAPPRSQHAWLVGGPWAGKTALLAEMVHALPPEVDCVAYFLTRPSGDADRERFLAAVVPQLAWLLDMDRPSVLDEYVFWQLWERAAQRAADTGRHLLLIVDGLDEDLCPGGHSVAGWLPGRLTGLPARVLVASRFYPRLPNDVDKSHPLAALTPDQLYTLLDSAHAARLRDLADQEITQLLLRSDDDLALDVLGLLTAARGPLSDADLAALTDSPLWKVRQVLTGETARTLHQVGRTEVPRYTFAHETILARCQQQGVGDPGHVSRIHEWAATWRARNWPAACDEEEGTPLYLLDTYLRTLYGDPLRLTTLAGDADWVTTAIGALGVDAVLVDLKAADDAASREPRLAAMHAVVQSQAHHLRGPETTDDPGFVPRQLCLQATEFGETVLAAGYRARQLVCDDPGPVLQWTTRRTSPALVLELGRDDDGVSAVAVLPDGRVVTGSAVGGGNGVLVWNPAEPGTSPIKLGRPWPRVEAMAVLPDGRVVTASVNGGGDSVDDGARLLVWDPAEPGTSPIELGSDELRVEAMAALPDGRVVTGSGSILGGGGRVLVWDPARPGVDPIELGRHEDEVLAVAVLPDGRVVTGGRRVLIWGPAEPGASPIELGSAGGIVGKVAVLPDGRLVTGDFDRSGRVLVWDPGEPGVDPIELGRHEDEVSGMAVLPDGRVVTGSGDAFDGGGRVLVWDPGTAPRDPIELGHDELGVGAMAVLPDGRVVTGSGGVFIGGGRVLVWDPGATPRDPIEFGRAGRAVSVMAVLPDGRVVTGDRSLHSGGGMLVWDPAESGASPIQLVHAGSTVEAVAVLPDGRVVTSERSLRSGGRMLIWDPAELDADPIELGHATGPAVAIAVLPDGRVVTGNLDDSGQVLVWDPAWPGADPIELGRQEYGVEAVAVLPDGRVVTGLDRVLIWDPAEPGASPIELGSAGGIVGKVAVLPDGRVVTGNLDRSGRMLVWDPARPGADPIELGWHKDGVSGMVVLPDGQVVTGNGVGDTVLLWKVLSSSPATLLACPGYALAVSSSPTGTRVLIGHGTDGISCWEVGTAAPATSGAQ
jgi:WD40 repeat protein